MTMQTSLWGSDFSIKEDDVKKIIEKAKKPKVVKEVSVEKKLKSKNVSIDEKMVLIEEDVNRILGSYKEDTLVIKDYDSLVNYFDKAIENNTIAIDTETNNTINVIDCKLMGLCIYTPCMKNAYVPVNHVNRMTDEKLSWQVTEEQIGTQLQRLLDNKVFEIYHNAYFDIPVLYTTCGVKLKADWDTMLAAQLLNENELAGLKYQYKTHINPEQDKYDIEHLFKGLPYSIFDPELFALYAATDSRMTYELYKYQEKEFAKDDNRDVYNVTFKQVEMPLVDTLVNMKLRGVNIDLEYSKKMSIEFHKKLDEVQTRVDLELAQLKPLIDSWKLTPEANEKQKKKDGSEGGKSKNEQLSDPIELSSPTQMAILLYDILKVPVTDKKSPRGTGADILEALAPKYKICSLLLEKRGIDILINTFIDKIPEFVQQKTGKLHCSFKSMGAATGRMSSSDPNLQQIPSHEKTIRMMFVPGKTYNKIEQIDNTYKVNYTDKVHTELNGAHYYKQPSELVAGDKLVVDDGTIDVVKSVEKDGDYYIIYV